MKQSTARPPRKKRMTKTAVQESTISGMTEAGVNDLLTEKPMGAMVLGGAREKLSEKILSHQREGRGARAMEAFIKNLEEFLYKELGVTRTSDFGKVTLSSHPPLQNFIQGLSSEELRAFLEEYACSKKEQCTTFFFWKREKERNPHKDSKLFESYQILKEIFGEETNQKIFEALHPSDDE